MSWDGAYYESRSVRVFHGAVDRTITRWQEAGWELVAQPRTGRRTELYFRRVNRPNGGTQARPPAPGLRDRPVALAAAGAAVLLVVGTVVLGATGDDLPAPAAAAAPAVGAGPAAGGVADPADAFAALLTEPDTCSDAVADFAGTYAGRAVEVDATVVATAARPGSTYDLLVQAGDHADDPAVGPAFALQGIALEDLHLTASGGRDYLTEGDDIRLTADVGAYDPDSCFLSLTPLLTYLR